MEGFNETVSEFIGIVKSWIPWPSGSTNVSRDFWMPDHSCRVCYHCDTQFTLFTRRHHCRVCDRVFVASVPQTLFLAHMLIHLASIDVMDYSLLVGMDEKKHELFLGIIDFMRQYTWDKHLETWVKASGILGGPKNASPTVISPKQYKKRFRKAMTTYFLMLPDQWSPPSIILSKSQNDLCEEVSKADMQSSEL